MSFIRRHVWISGTVQGVCFRESTRQCALEHQVTGWVKNLSDGRVEAVFQGNLHSVEQLVSFVHQGPEFAEVTHVEVKEEQPDETLQGFSVARK